MQKRHTCMYVICTPHHMHVYTHLNTHRHARAWCMQTAPCGCPLRNTFLPSPSFSIIHSLSILCPAPCWSLSLRYLYILSTSHFMEKSGFPPISLLDLRISWFTLLPLLWNKRSLLLPSLSPKPGSSLSSPCLLTPLCPLLWSSLLYPQAEGFPHLLRVCASILVIDWRVAEAVLFLRDLWLVSKEKQPWH